MINHEKAKAMKKKMKKKIPETRFRSIEAFLLAALIEKEIFHAI